MIRKLFFLICIILQTAILPAQKGYYSKDRKMWVGVNMVDGGPVRNARICQVKEKNQIKTYTPYEVNEYGFNDGRIYMAKVIPLKKAEKRVFLERLSKGAINVYYYKDKEGKKFFIEKDSGQLVEIFKRDTLNKKVEYREMLSPYLEACDYIADQLPFVHYRKLPFQRFADYYNKCQHRPFPHLRFGVTAGFGLSRISTSSSDVPILDGLNTIDFKYDGSMNLGMFIDIPVLVSDFSLNTGLFYTQNEFFFNYRDESIDVDLAVNTASLNIPVLFRYTYSWVKYRPFINAGVAYSYNIKSESRGFYAKFNNEIIELGNFENDQITFKHLVGLTAGCGIQISITPRNDLFIEFRYLNSFGVNTAESIRSNSFNLLSGINF